VPERNLRRIVAWLALGALVVCTATARADERTEARAHFKKGMAAIAEGHYDSGIEELKKAYDILPHPNVLYNIARAYVDVGDLENAVIYYRRYLEGNPKDRDEVAQIVASLEARIRKQQAQLLEAQQAAGVAPSPAGPGAPAPSPTAQVAPVPGQPGPGPGVPPGAAVAPTPTARGARPAAVTPSGGTVEAGELKTEEVFEETVVTASRTAQSPLDAPNSTSIITAQDIRLSGITKIPELLRRLAGVDIMETTGGQTEVSIRGFNQRLSNKVLVLIDGRSVYVDLIGATLWATLPIGVEDIERIEVVRGPGSALYGADAFNGVVNIITKPPGEGGSGLNVGYGDRDSAHGTVWASGRDKELAYRLSAGFDNLPRWSREVPPGRSDANVFIDDQNIAQRSYRINGTVTRQLGNDVTLGVQGGYAYDNPFEILAVGLINDFILKPITAGDASVFLNSKHFEARVFWNNYFVTNANNAAYVGQSFFEGNGRVDIVDGEAQYVDQFETGHGIDHDLHVGAAYRLKRIEWTYLAQSQTENHTGFFVHDEIKLGRQFALIGDYRADFVPYLNRVVQSPRGSILVHPSKQSTVRGIIATAFRTPDFLESYLGTPVPLPVSGGALIASSSPPDSKTAFTLQPEQIITGELGYLNAESDYFTVDSAFFYNRVTNLIELTSPRALTVGDLANPMVPTQPSDSTGYYPFFLNGWQNACRKYNVYGAELGVRVFPVEGLDVYANYTAMDVNQDSNGCSGPQPQSDTRTSASKVNTGVQLRTKAGIDGSIDFHYLSPQDWAEQVQNLQKQDIEFHSFHLDAYTLLNASLGYRFLRNQAEIRGVVFNLLDDQHREHPYGQYIDRRVMGFFSYKF
jgi:iron complex outermembrane receptor protein